MGKLNVMQHPVYNALHVCNGCGRIKLVTKWVKFDSTYLGPDAYLVPTHCPDCFRNIISIMEDKKKRRNDMKLERKIRNRIKKKLT